MTQEKSVVQSVVKLSNEERLEYQNIHLQRQMLSMQGAILNKQEADLARRIHERQGVDITGWNVNLESGVCVPPQEEKKS
jgi:hypothetical protein